MFLLFVVAWGGRWVYSRAVGGGYCCMGGGGLLLFWERNTGGGDYYSHWGGGGVLFSDIHPLRLLGLVRVQGLEKRKRETFAGKLWEHNLR